MSALSPGAAGSDDRAALLSGPQRPCLPQRKAKPPFLSGTHPHGFDPPLPASPQLSHRLLVFSTPRFPSRARRRPRPQARHHPALGGHEGGPVAQPQLGLQRVEVDLQLALLLHLGGFVDAPVVAEVFQLLLHLLDGLLGAAVLQPRDGAPDPLQELRGLGGGFGGSRWGGAGFRSGGWGGRPPSLRRRRASRSPPSGAHSPG